MVKFRVTRIVEFAHEVEADRDEGRRLLYVGMTRAQQGVYLTFARQRRGLPRYQDARGPSLSKHQSVFVDDICNRLGMTPDDGEQFVAGLPS